nr:translation initiation factor IF-2 [Oryctolagus cuniculus]
MQATQGLACPPFQLPLSLPTITTVIPRKKALSSGGATRSLAQPACSGCLLVPGLTERLGRRLREPHDPHNSIGALLAAGHGPGPHLPAAGAGAVGLPAAARSFIPRRTHDTEPTLQPSETRALSAFKGRGGAGGPATQQQPRLRAVAGVRGPCARRAARRPTLHKGSMARPRLAGSPTPRPRSRPGEGLAPSTVGPASSGPHPLPGGAARPNAAPGTQLRRAGGRRSHCDVSSLRGYLYPHDWISFMKPGPGVSVLWGAVAKVPQLYARPRDPGSQHGPGQPGAEPGRPRPFSSAVARGCLCVPRTHQDYFSHIHPTNLMECGCRASGLCQALRRSQATYSLPSGSLESAC